MIKYSNEQKTLVIPSSLGNFPSTGGGGGSDVTRQDVIDIVESAITDYDTEIQVDLEDIRENVSGNTDNIEALSATTENMAQSIGAINTNIEALSAATVSNSQQIGDLSGLSTDISAISGQTSANTQDIVDLSGVTENIQTNVNTLSGSVENIQTNVESLSAVTSGIAADLETMSGQTEQNASDLSNLSAVTEDIYNTIFYEDESGETYSQIDDLWTALGDKQDVLEAGDGINVDGSTISAKIASRGLEFNGDGEIQLVIGRGLAMSGTSLVANIGEGLGFSGNTIVVSGGSGNGPRVIFLNKLSQQECLDLYDELAAQYDYQANGWTSAFTENEYQFYIDLREYSDQNDFQVADHYEGFFPMQVCRMHPTDYGGGAFFTGVEQDREGNGHIICIRFTIAYDGQTERGTWWNNPVDTSTLCLYVDPQGDFGHRAVDVLFDEGSIYRVAVKGCELDFSAEYGFGSVVYSRRYNQNDQWHYQWSLIVPTDTGAMKGVWHSDQLDDLSTYVRDSWTAV